MGTPIFVAILITIAKGGSDPSAHQSINVVYTKSTENSALKTKETLTIDTTWANLKDIVLCETSHHMKTNADSTSMRYPE